MNAQKLEFRDPFHTVTDYEKWPNVCSFPSEVNDQLLGLCGVQEQVILSAPQRQLLHLISISGLVPPSPNTVVSSANLIMMLVGWMAVQS